MLEKTLAWVLAAALFVALTGCNTIHGIGMDMEAAGEGIQEASSD